MIVPNYIPDPVEIPNNVTLQPYLVRLAFLRRVLLFHFASLGLIALLSVLHAPHVGFLPAVVLVAICMVCLSLVRIETRGTRADLWLSTGLLPLLLIGLSFIVREAADAGFPMWAMPFGTACAVIYSLLCGRDFSFVGQFFLSLVVSNVAIAILANAAALSSETAAWALAANSAYLFYTVYDSAALMARRRLGEEVAAVVDLYRDVLNFFGYIVRCIRHWRRYRLWSAR